MKVGIYGNNNINAILKFFVSLFRRISETTGLILIGLLGRQLLLKGWQP